MDQKENIPHKLLCMACLCVNRSLRKVEEEKYKRFFLDACNEIPLCNTQSTSPIICWECDAQLRRAVMFKEQVKDSHWILQAYSSENLHEFLLTDVIQRNRLKVINNLPISISPEEATSNEVQVIRVKGELKNEDSLKETNTLACDGEAVNAEDSPESNVRKRKRGRIGVKNKRKKKIRKQQDGGDRPEAVSGDDSECGSQSPPAGVDGGKVEVGTTIEEVKIEWDVKDNLKETHAPSVGGHIILPEDSVESNMRKRKRDRTDTKNRRVPKVRKQQNGEDRPEVSGDDFDCKSHSPSAGDDEGKVEVEVAVEELKIEWDAKESKTSNMTDEKLSDRELDNEIEAYINKVKNRNEKRASRKLRRAEKIVKRLQKKTKAKKKTKAEDNSSILTIELSYEEMQMDRQRDLTRENYINSEFKCETCIVGFQYGRSFNTHNATKHDPKLGSYVCPICQTIISSVESFTAHYKRHMRRYECSVCRKRSLDLKSMQQHYESTHSLQPKQYTCHICGTVSNSIDTHRYHKDTHKARVQCPDCDKTFTHRAGLLNHRLSVHEMNNEFPCTVCDKVFRWKTSLKRHLDQHNAKARAAAAYCAECEVTFTSLCSYQRHLKNSLKHVTQEQLRFICDHCGRRFADKTKLRDHIEEKHLHKTYQCHICLKPSKNRVGLDQHIRNVHKGRPNNKICHHCGKGFPTKMQLESHIRTHTGERPFICEFCPTTFSQQSNLYKHNRQVHLNIKSKRYPMCKKRKDDKQAEPPEQPPAEPYRPVVVLQYSPETGFVI